MALPGHRRARDIRGRAGTLASQPRTVPSAVKQTGGVSATRGLRPVRLLRQRHGRDRKASRGFESTVYQCTRRSRSGQLCTHHNILTKTLDDAVWARVDMLLTQPDVVSQEPERLRRTTLPRQSAPLLIERCQTCGGRRRTSPARSRSSTTLRPLHLSLHRLKRYEGRSVRSTRSGRRSSVDVPVGQRGSSDLRISRTGAARSVRDWTR